jgi:hypothetical protein
MQYFPDMPQRSDDNRFWRWNETVDGVKLGISLWDDGDMMVHDASRNGPYGTHFFSLGDGPFQNWRRRRTLKKAANFFKKPEPSLIPPKKFFS